MRERWIAAGLLSAIAVTAALVIIVLQFGVEHPSPPSLMDAPVAAIPGEIIYRNDQHCVTRIPASGAAPAREICLASLDFFDGLAWVDERTVVVASGQSLVTVDLETGIETSREEVTDGAPYPDADRAPSGELAAIDRDGHVHVMSGASKTEIADFDTDGWRLRIVLWSPDSQWLVLNYMPPRSPGSELWIISRDGSVKGTLAKDVWGGGSASWRIDGVGITSARLYAGVVSLDGPKPATVTTSP